MLVVLGFQLAWQPAAFADSTQHGGLQRIAVDGRRIMVGVAATAVGIAVISPELIRIASGSVYLAALPALGYALVFTIAFAGYHVATMPSAISAQNERYLGISAVVAAVDGRAALPVVVDAMGGAGRGGGNRRRSACRDGARLRSRSPPGSRAVRVAEDPRGLRCS